MDDHSLYRLASEWWSQTGDDSDHHDADAQVTELVRAGSDSMPALIRAMASTAPDGALSYIGVAILEGLTTYADHHGRADAAIDVLLSADLDRHIVYEILSGPYPEYLERWGVRDRFVDIFSPAQLEALQDWSGRRDQRLILDGDGFRLVKQSSWFARWTSGVIDEA